MRKFYLLSTLVLTVLLYGQSATAQDFSNKGKDFWVGYGYHQVMVNGNQQEMVLYFATDQVTNITISIPGTGYTQNLTSPAGNNVLTSATIPKSGAQDARLQTEGISDKGIHITSDKPMVAYAHVYNSSVSGATILFPTNTLGKEYYSVNYKNTSNSANANCYFYVIATDPGTTTVEITPSANTVGGWLAGTLHTVNLNQGQVYMVMGALTSNTNPFTGVDLTGSKIKSIASASGACKHIAVFSGSGRISITCNASSSSSDNYMVQDFPRNAWGKKFLTVPAAGNQSFNLYRICVSDPTTVVKINGTVTALPLQNNFYYEISQTNQPQMIEADKAVTVAQYFSSQGSCGNGSPGDPEVIYLSPIEQNINKVLWNATPNFAITNNYFNIVLPNTGTAISSFRLDGAPVAAGSFITHPQDPNYSYLRQSVTSGFHMMQSDSGFNGIAYGFGNAESYGYNVGTNIKDIFQQIGVSSQYGIEPTPSVCKNSPFKFKVSLPYCADSLSWNLTNLPGPPPAPPTQIYSTCTPGPGGPDSITVVSGKTIYWYSLPSLYSFNVAGSFPVTITTYAPNADGCGNVQNIDFNLDVYEPPIADFFNTTPGCPADPVQFNDNTETPRPNYLWSWDFGDPASGAANTSTLKNPVHTFSGPGTYTVTFYSINTPGCFSNTFTKQITVPNPPNGSLASDVNTVCLNGTSPIVTFTGTNGKPPYTFSYTIDNGSGPGPVQTISTVGPATTATITVPTTTAGTIRYKLVEIKNTGSAVCITPLNSYVDVVVNPLPTASLTGNITVCQNAPSPNVTFTGAAGTAPYTFSYKINGVVQPDVTTVSGNSISLPVSTATPGSYLYELVGVKEGSAVACTQPQTGSVTVVVNPLPTASISGNTQVCLNAPSPNVTFTGAGGTAPYKFTYKINGVLQPVITTVAGNSITIAAPTNVAGTFIYDLVSVQEGSSTLCNQSQTGTVTVVVNPLPTASIAGTTQVCVNAPSPNITFTGAGGTAPYTFTYNINGGAPQTVTTTVGNSVTVAVPTTAAGTFNYNLVSVQDASASLCSQAQSGTSTVIVNPLPTASLAGNISVCKNAPSPNVTFTGGAGTPPYTFTYNINGGAPLTVSTTVGNSVTVAVPTTTAGTFNYNLVSVQDASTTLCSQNQPATVTVQVNDLPTANISGTTEVCKDAPSPLITFTGAGTSAPYTFTYTLNAGPPQSITTAAGNSVTIAVPTTTPGTFTYTLVSVKDATSTLCSQAQSGSATVIVNPLPTPDFVSSVPSCETKIISFTNSSLPNVGGIATANWNFGDPGSGPLNTSTTLSPTHTYAAAGTYAVTLSVTNTKGCVSNPVLTRNITINPQPVADFDLPEICVGDPFALFHDLSTVPTGTITGWSWNFGDPGSGPLNTSNVQNGQHTYTTVGVFNVSLTVTSDKGCQHTITKPFTVNGAIPVSNFNALNPASLCANDSVSIQDASSVNFGTITKVEIYWDNVNFPLGPPGTYDLDNNPTPGKIYKHKYADFQSPLTKTFSIRYRAYSGGTCVDDRIKTITVNASPKVQFNAIPDVCLDVASYQITQASEIGAVPGTGVFSGPGVNATGLFTPSLVGPGTYRIKYTYTSSAGGCVDTLSQTIRVLEPATASFSFSSLACQNSAVSFNSSGSSIPAGNGTITGWVWDFGDPASGAGNNTSTLQNPSHTFSGWGDYTVKLYVTTSNSCKSAIATQTVHVNPIPRPNFSVPASSCLPSASVVFNSSASAIADGTQGTFTYLWNFGDPGSGVNNTSTSSSPTHIYNAVGPYSVNLQITSGAGCVHDTTIIVNSIHPQPTGSFTVDKPDVCVGQSITFTDNSNPADGTTSTWNWDMGDGNTRSNASFNYTYSPAGTYNATLYITNSFGCRSTSYTKQVTINPYPVVNAGPDLFILQDGSDTLEPVITAINPTYLWTPNLYFISSNTIKNPVVKGVEDITYTLTVTGRGNCVASDQVFIKVLKGPEIPNIFSPNGDGVHDTWVIKYLDTYPECTVEVFNRYGQRIFSSVGYGTPWDGTVNGKQVPMGTYYYIVNPKNGRKTMSGYVDVIR